MPSSLPGLMDYPLQKGAIIMPRIAPKYTRKRHHESRKIIHVAHLLELCTIIPKKLAKLTVT